MHLEAREVTVATGTIVDATQSSAPPGSPKNAARGRDPEMPTSKTGLAARVHQF
jgi:hypothetical protein